MDRDTDFAVWAVAALSSDQKARLNQLYLKHRRWVEEGGEEPEPRKGARSFAPGVPLTLDD